MILFMPQRDVAIFFLKNSRRAEFYNKCSHRRVALAESYTWGEGRTLIGFRRAQPRERRDEWQEVRRDFSQQLGVRHLGGEGEMSKADFFKAVKSTTFLRKPTIRIHIILQASGVRFGLF